MNVFEMEGFLRGKCLPGDMKVNETTAEYLVRKLGQAGELTAAHSTLEKAREVTNCPADVDLQDHLKQLVAESAAIKAMNDCLAEELRGYESDGAFDGPNMHLLWWKCETPATDSILRAAEATAWIEGSEPPEFGRYWVRYETDVGPRYCSAQWMEHNFCASSTTNIHKLWLADHSRSIVRLRGVTHYTKLPDSLESKQLREGKA